ncbi:von Willebrand factor A domain-containing protein 5A, partial [Halocaridina rubra]
MLGIGGYKHTREQGGVSQIKMRPSEWGYWGLIGRCIAQAPSIQVVKLKSVTVDVSVRGFVAKVSACSTYVNTTKYPLQIEYRIPVDESAAVYSFEAIVNGRKIIAQCMEKKKAENIYKEAVTSGHTAVLAREDRLMSDILHLALGNLPAGETVELKLRMIMELRVKSDGAVNFTLPTVLLPRYCPQDIAYNQHTTSVARFGGFCFEPPEFIAVSDVYSTDIRATVNGGPSISHIVSYSDALNVNISDDGMSAEVTQDGSFKADHDWMILVYYRNPYKTHVIRETGERSSTGLMKDDLLMINIHPEVPQHSYSNRNEIVFIVDCSGSMRGENIQSARATLLLFLKALPMGVYFNVICFGSTFSLLFPEGSQIFTENTFQKSIMLQKSMEANLGGTEILQPLKYVYSQPLKPGHGRQIILLSDGEVMNVDQVKQLVSRNAHETRVFAVGIGHGASTALIKGLARAGKGKSDMVYQQDKLQFKVMGLVKCMLQENVQDVSVIFNVDPPCGVKLVPKVPPVIFGGQHLIMYTRLPQATEVKSATVKGTLESEILNFNIKGTDIITSHDEDMILHRLAARAQILEWQIDEEEDVGGEMIALSVTSGVVSRLTALVGVDQDESSVVAVQQVSPQPVFSFRSCNMSGGFGNTNTATGGSSFYAPSSAAGFSFNAPSSAAGGALFGLSQSLQSSKQHYTEKMACT